MGCDIHLVLEKKIGTAWVGVDLFNPFRSWIDGSHQYPLTRNRNYRRFAALAGVRGDGPSPRGLPDDLSALALDEVNSWDGDGHSHSYLPISDAALIFAYTEFHPDHAPYEMPWGKHPVWYFFNVDDIDADKYRLIFFFDS